MFNNELYIPRAAVLEDIKDLTYDTRLYRIKFKSHSNGESRENDYKPGQFVQVSVLGAGEVPISLCSSPTDENHFELCIRDTGAVTGAISKLASDNEIGIRGPYGNFFPVEQMRGQDLMFVAGGIGLAPLRSVIKYVLHNRENYGKVTILYGARTMQDVVFTDELEEWDRNGGACVLSTIDTAQEGWTGNVGVVTTLFAKISNIERYKALVCGPSIMIHFAIKELLDRGLEEENIITTLERHMKCGVGKCGHCYIGGKYVCTDGPVFTYAQIKQMNVRV